MTVAMVGSVPSDASCCYEKTRNTPRMELDEAVKVVNFVKPRPLNSRALSVLCDVPAHGDSTVIRRQLRYRNVVIQCDHRFSFHRVCLTMFDLRG